MRGCFADNVLDRSSCPQRRIVRNANLHGQFIRRAEADAPDVVRQFIRVGPHLFDGTVAVSFVNANRAGRADAVALQEDHDITDVLLFMPTLADALDPLGTDSLDLAQKRRRLVDNVERLLAKCFDDFLGIGRANPFHKARREILFDAR